MFLHRFRWVYCQLEVLRHTFPANLRRTLEELPKSLDETYKRILKEINNTNREHAYRLLQCLAVASRPLKVEELAEVLAFDFTGGIPKSISDWRWEDREDAVLSACSSLISVISNYGSRIVQFSHFSVKEFLTSERLSDGVEDFSQFHIPMEPSHVILAKACLGVLLRLGTARTETLSRKFLFLDMLPSFGISMRRSGLWNQRWWTQWIVSLTRTIHIFQRGSKYRAEANSGSLISQSRTLRRSWWPPYPSPRGRDSVA